MLFELNIIFAVLCALFAFAGAAMLMPTLISRMQDKGHLDRPNARSSHDTPTPVGGGWAVVPICLVGILSLFLAFNLPLMFLVLIGATLLLMIVSWEDDLDHVSPLMRLVVQALCVGATIYIFPSDLMLFQGHVPFWLDRAIAFWALLWFVNLYNFMDGIDGITGMQTASIGIGMGVILLVSGVGGMIWPGYGFVLGGAALAFLLFNWHPAKIFIGDVGAVPLGLLIGWYLIYCAGLGLFWPACIVGLYYCFDATVTLVSRLARGHAAWEPHREFFFLRPVPHTLSHSGVVLRILGLNIALFICAYLVATADDFWTQAVPAILASGFATMALMAYFYAKRENNE